MTQAERDRLVALKKAKKKLIMQKQAAEEIGITERQVRRLLRKLGRKGDQAIIHELRGRASNRKSGWTAPSVLLATGRVGPFCRRCALLDSQGRNHRPRAPGGSSGRGMRPKDTVAGICPSRFRACLRKFVPAVHQLRPHGTELAASSTLRNVASRCRCNSDYTQPAQTSSRSRG